MPKKYPPLSPEEVIAILQVFGFSCKGTRGSHHQYEGKTNGVKRKVTVDQSIPEFNDFLIKSMIEQSGISRVDFYCATKRTAKKINKSCNK